MCVCGCGGRWGESFISRKYGVAVTLRSHGQATNRQQIHVTTFLQLPAHDVASYLAAIPQPSSRLLLIVASCHIHDASLNAHRDEDVTKENKAWTKNFGY